MRNPVHRWRLSIDSHSSGERRRNTSASMSALYVFRYAISITLSPRLLSSGLLVYTYSMINTSALNSILQTFKLRNFKGLHDFRFFFRPRFCPVGLRNLRSTVVRVCWQLDQTQSRRRMLVINSAAVLACDQIFMVPFTILPMIDDGVCMPIGFDARRLFGKSTQSLCGVVGIRRMGYEFH